eukprot:13981092-Heterocapsa_arctica.AAC.1
MGIKHLKQKKDEIKIEKFCVDEFNETISSEIDEQKAYEEKFVLRDSLRRSGAPADLINYEVRRGASVSPGKGRRRRGACRMTS